MTSRDRAMSAVYVFERGGHVYVFASLSEAAESIESLDVEAGFYEAAFTSEGERVELRAQPDLWASLTRTGVVDPDGLRLALLRSRLPEAAIDPVAWADRRGTD